MTARALIVNHWQHYWTSPLLPIWICVGRQGERVINHSITHRFVRTQTSSKHWSTTAPPNISYADTCPHAQKHSADYNKCADNKPLSVDHLWWQFCFQFSAIIYWCIVWIMSNKRKSRARVSETNSEAMQSNVYCWLHTKSSFSKSC